MPRLSLIERAAEVFDFKPPPLSDDAAVAQLMTGSVATSTRQVPLDPERLRHSGLIVPGEAPTALAEEFRLVKRQLLLNTRDAGANGRTILLTSAQPGDGKTFCAINLALSLATERDTRVLLIDGDVAKPQILSTLGIVGEPGLMDALADPTLEVERLVITTDLDGLSILPAGAAHAADTELIASARGRAVFEQLATTDPARILVIDCAPALAASPASVMALHAGQVVMVVRADRTTETDLRDALSLVSGQAKISLLLNGASFSGSGRSFGSYYGDHR